MPTHSRPPTYAQRALTDSRLLRRLVSLVGVGLLAVIALCALPHGPTEETHRPAVSAVTASGQSSVGDAAPHGPHRHHASAECAPDGIVRTTAQAVEQPPAGAGVLTIAGVLAVVGRPLARRPAYRRRRARTGRTALVRTSRWRI